MADPPKRRITGGILAPLVDENGVPFEHVPCQDNPFMWDEDAPRADKRHAAALCRRACPALDACWQRRREVGPRASGVWAGRILRDVDETARVSTALRDDPELAMWAASAGVTIRPGPTGRTPE